MTRRRPGPGRVASRVVGLALLGTVSSSASGEQAVKGHVLDADDVGRVWIAAVGADARNTEWTLVESGQFELPASPVVLAGLVAVAKNRVPLAIPFPMGEQGRQLELRLSQGLTLEGSVRSEDGVPLGGVTIRAVRADTVVHDILGKAGFAVSLQDTKVEIGANNGGAIEVPPAVRPTWETDRHGAFRIAGLVVGRYLVEATAAGHVPVLRETTIRKSGVNRLELLLQEAFFVAGHVVDQAGAPVAGAAVSADWRPHEARADRNESVGWSSRRRTVVSTGDDGSYRLGPFEAGPPLPVFATSGDSGSSRRHEVTAPFDGLLLQLRRHVVRGQVVDATTAERVETFRVHAHRNGGMQTTSYADGRFELVVDPDTDSIHVEAPGRFPWFTRIFTSHGACTNSV